MQNPFGCVRFAGAWLLAVVALVGIARAQVDPQVPPGFTLVDDMILPTDVVQNRAVYTTNLWPNVIAFEYDANVSPTNRGQARTAMDTIEAIADIQFVERTNEPNYFRFVSSTSNNSFVGVAFAGQPINIVSWHSQITIIHELFHLLGRWHEHQRSDRDQFVQINTGNIQGGKEGNFFLRSTNPIFGAYDFESIMHYHRCTFSICCPPSTACNCLSSCQTITVQPGFEQWQFVLGQRSQLSTGDADWLVFAYGAIVIPSDAPRVFDSMISTPVAQSVVVEFSVSDNGLPDPPGAVFVTITSLPQNGVLIDPSGLSLLTTVPVDLPLGVTSVTYVPLGAFVGTDSIVFHADDGGTPPSGGTSSEATAQISVGNRVPITQMLKDGVLGAPIGVQGLWTVGIMLGLGGTNESDGAGFPDPTNGLTQRILLGYNQVGNYEANLLTTRYATFGPIDCTDCRSAELSYARWLGVGQAASDHASVEVSVDAGATWVTVWEHTGGNLLGGAWTPITHAIGNIVDGQPSVLMRWGMGPTDGATQYAGWNLDAIELLGVDPLAECPGDGDFSRVVNFDDITAVLTNWGKVGATQRQGDTNADAIVNFDDITVVLSNWLANCP